MFVIKNHWPKERLISVETSPVKKMICFKSKRKNHYFYLGFPTLKMYLNYRFNFPIGETISKLYLDRATIISYNTNKKPVCMPLSNFDHLHEFCMPKFSVNIKSSLITKDDIEKFATKAVNCFYTSAFTSDTYYGLICAYDCHYFSDKHIELLNKWQANTKANKKFRFKVSKFDFDENEKITLGIKNEN